MDQTTLTHARQSTDKANYLYLDIESIPSRDLNVMSEIIAKHATEALDESTIMPAANLTDPAKIAADIEKRLEKARADQVALVNKAANDTDEEYRKTALDATTGHIACISAALGEGAVFHRQNAALGLFSKPKVVFSAEGDPRRPGDMITIEPGLKMVLADERTMLIEFFADLEMLLRHRAVIRAGLACDSRATKFTGKLNPGDKFWFNGRDREGHIKEFLEDFLPTPIIVAHHAQFDVRFIWQRCVILGVPVPNWWPIDAKPWDQNRLQDTMLMWAGATGRIGLDRLCRALGIPGKADMDGSMVWDAIRDGRINDVVEYCDSDVERLRNVHRRILALPVAAAAVEEAA